MNQSQQQLTTAEQKEECNCNFYPKKKRKETNKKKVECIGNKFISIHILYTLFLKRNIYLIIMTTSCISYSYIFIITTKLYY